jgi:putative intracellular protease/amidase
MKIAILLYPGVTALDAIGPYEVLSRLPEATVHFVARTTEPIITDTKMLRLLPELTLQEMPHPDILLVPGATEGFRAVMGDEATLDWIRTAHATSRWTTSVCTGALILGAAGVLNGLEATTHWAARQALTLCGATPTSQRVVKQGKVITAAGVSAGIDMALQLAAEVADEDTAKVIQLMIEYDPQPPFDTGAPQKATENIVQKAIHELTRGAR